MKLIKSIFHIALAILAVTACDRSDPGEPVDLGAGGGNGLGDNQQANAAILEMNEKYDVQFKYVFTENELSYNWTEMINMEALETQPADPEYIARVMEFLDTEVFTAFPEGLLQEALPPVILLVAECRNPYSIVYAPPREEETGYNMLCGFPTQNVLIISDVGPRFQPNRETREKLISLIVERLTANTKALPPADDFYAVVGPGNWLSPGYWSGSLSDSHYFWDTITSEEQALMWQWKNSFLKMSKIEYREVDFSYDTPDYTIMKNTQGQDLGDYYVFVTQWTQQERDEFYDMVYRKVDETFPFDKYDENDAQSTIDDIKKKVQLAKNYFNEHYGMNIAASVE